MTTECIFTATPVITDSFEWNEIIMDQIHISNHLFCIDRYNQLIYQSLLNQHLCLCCVFDPEQRTFHSNVLDFALYKYLTAL